MTEESNTCNWNLRKFPDKELKTDCQARAIKDGMTEPQWVASKLRKIIEIEDRDPQRIKKKPKA